MKTIILGDIHGRTIWKDILKVEEPYDRVIFIGDYVDTHEDITGAEQLYNLQEIIQFKETAFDFKVILLIGNHDFQYWPGGNNERYSGFQAGMFHSFQDVFSKNKELFQMCFVDENDIIYSHAGFTESFVNQRIGNFSEKNVNDIFKYKPQTFNFFYGDYSGCGDDVRQSCIWVRPNSLYKDKLDNLQVVGHTQVSSINHPPKSERRGFYLIDALASRQYLVLNDKKFEIKQLPK